jgi:hypothetical protein
VLDLLESLAADTGSMGTAGRRTVDHGSVSANFCLIRSITGPIRAGRTFAAIPSAPAKKVP